MARGFATALQLNAYNNHPSLFSTASQLMKPAREAWDRSKRLRVGLLSADFKDKATSYLLNAVLQYMDPDIEIYVYATTMDNDGIIVQRF